MSGYDLWKLRRPYEDEGPEPEEIAEFYCIAPEAIEARQAVIPVDDEVPLDMKKLRGGSDAAPIGIPFHRGARKFFRERGYL